MDAPDLFWESIVKVICCQCKRPLHDDGEGGEVVAHGFCQGCFDLLMNQLEGTKPSDCLGCEPVNVWQEIGGEAGSA